MMLGMILSPMVAETLQNFCLDVIPFKRDKLPLFGFIGVGTVVKPLEKSSATVHDCRADGFTPITFAVFGTVVKVVKAGLDEFVEQDIARMIDKLTSPSSKNNIFSVWSDDDDKIVVKIWIHCNGGLMMPNWENLGKMW